MLLVVLFFEYLQSPASVKSTGCKPEDMQITEHLSIAEAQWESRAMWSYPCPSSLAPWDGWWRQLDQASEQQQLLELGQNKIGFLENTPRGRLGIGSGLPVIYASPVTAV